MYIERSLSIDIEKCGACIDEHFFCMNLNLHYLKFFSGLFILKEKSGSHSEAGPGQKYGGGGLFDKSDEFNDLDCERSHTLMGELLNFDVGQVNLI